MAQAERPFQILANPAPPAVDAARDRARHRGAVLCHQAHAELVARVAALKPHRIANHFAEVADIEARGTHLRDVLTATTTYVVTIIEDTNENVGLGAIDAKYIEGYLADLASELAGAFAVCAERTSENVEFGGRV